MRREALDEMKWDEMRWGETGGIEKGWHQMKHWYRNLGFELKTSGGWQGLLACDSSTSIKLSMSLFCFGRCCANCRAKCLVFRGNRFWCETERPFTRRDQSRAVRQGQRFRNSGLGTIENQLQHIISIPSFPTTLDRLRNVYYVLLCHSNHLNHRTSTPTTKSIWGIAAMENHLKMA